MSMAAAGNMNMYYHLPMFNRLMILCGVLAAGCTFDAAGPGFGALWELDGAQTAADLGVDIPWGDGPPADSTWLDIAVVDAPPPDMAMPDKATPDKAMPDKALPKDLPRPDKPPGQGTTCSNAGIHFVSSAPPAACAKINIRVRAKAPFAWVLARVSAASSPGSVNWKNKPKVTKCNQDTCWDFANVQVPCAAGPFTFHFMKDATGDDAKKGIVVGKCTP